MNDIGVNKAVTICIVATLTALCFGGFLTSAKTIIIEHNKLKVERDKFWLCLPDNHTKGESDD